MANEEQIPHPGNECPSPIPFPGIECPAFILQLDELIKTLGRIRDLMLRKPPNRPSGTDAK
jgi:hypothetical protein